MRVNIIFLVMIVLVIGVKICIIVQANAILGRKMSTMGKLTLKFTEGYMLCCPLCGTFEFESPARYTGVQAFGENWVTCSRCGTTYKRVWQAAGSCANRKVKEKM
jgi:hypothetical protein